MHCTSILCEQKCIIPLNKQWENITGCILKPLSHLSLKLVFSTQFLGYNSNKWTKLHWTKNQMVYIWKYVKTPTGLFQIDLIFRKKINSKVFPQSAEEESLTHPLLSCEITRYRRKSEKKVNLKRTNNCLFFLTVLRVWCCLHRRVKYIRQVLAAKQTNTEFPAWHGWGPWMRTEPLKIAGYTLEMPNVKQGHGLSRGRGAGFKIWQHSVQSLTHMRYQPLMCQTSPGVTPYHSYKTRGTT